MIDLRCSSHSAALVALAVVAFLTPGCVTKDFLSLAETRRLLDADARPQAPDKKPVEKCFLAELPGPAKVEQTAPVSVAVFVTDNRPTYKNYAMLAFVFLVPFAHGEVPGVPPMTCLEAGDKCIDYRHVIGLLVAKNLRASEGVAQARYEEFSANLRKYDLRLKITLEDLHTDNIIIGYGLGPFCGVPWILALPMGRVGLEGKGSWELSETRSGKVIEKGGFAVNDSKTVALYYSTTQTAYSREGVMGEAVGGVVATITDGALQALRRQPPEYWAELAKERELLLPSGQKP